MGRISCGLELDVFDLLLLVRVVEASTPLREAVLAVPLTVAEPEVCEPK